MAARISMFLRHKRVTFIAVTVKIIISAVENRKLRVILKRREQAVCKAVSLE